MIKFTPSRLLFTYPDGFAEENKLSALNPSLFLNENYSHDILPIAVYFIGPLWRTTCPIQSNFGASFDFGSAVEINENRV